MGEGTEIPHNRHKPLTPIPCDKEPHDDTENCGRRRGNRNKEQVLSEERNHASSGVEDLFLPGKQSAEERQVERRGS